MKTAAKVSMKMLGSALIGGLIGFVIGGPVALLLSAAQGALFGAWAAFDIIEAFHG